MQLLLSSVQEVDTGIAEMAEAYSRIHGTSLPESRQEVSRLMTEVLRDQRSRPERTPVVELEAAEGDDYAGTGPELTRGVPPGTKEKTIPSTTKTKDSTPGERRKDGQYLVFNSSEAVDHLARIANVSRMDARRFLAEGDGEDLPAPKPRARSQKGATYSSEDLQAWAKTWAARKRQPKPISNPPLQARDINPDSRKLFGDTAQHKRCRQPGSSHFLASDFFRS